MTTPEPGDVILTVDLPLPPTVRKCWTKRVDPDDPKKSFEVASADFRAWLKLAAPAIRRALPTGWKPDGHSYWEITALFRMPIDSPPAHEMLDPIIDALSGTRMNGNKIERPGALYADKSRVARWSGQISSRNNPEHRAGVTVIAAKCPCPPRFEVKRG